MAETQRIFHIITEALAIPVGIFLIFAGIKLKKIPFFYRFAFVLIGAGNLIIDGYMLTTW